MADLSGGAAASNTTQPNTANAGVPVDPNLNVSDIPLYGDPAFNAFMAKSGYTNSYLANLAQQKVGNLNAALNASLPAMEQNDQRQMERTGLGEESRGVLHSSQFLKDSANLAAQQAAQRSNAINNTASQIGNVQQNLVNQIISQQQNAAQQGINAGANVAAGKVPTATTNTATGSTGSQ